MATATIKTARLGIFIFWANVRCALTGAIEKKVEK